MEVQLYARDFGYTGVSVYVPAANNKIKLSILETAMVAMRVQLDYINGKGLVQCAGWSTQSFDCTQPIKAEFEPSLPRQGTVLPDMTADQLWLIIPKPCPFPLHGKE